MPRPWVGEASVNQCQAAQRWAPEEETVTGSELIAKERLRQIEEEGYGQEHDIYHYWDVLADAGVAYALNASPGHDGLPFWPWHADAWNPKDPLRDLVRAGALIAAAIDRYQATPAATPPPAAQE